MNDIIDKLIKRSYVTVNSDYHVFSPEKFAELIVQECVDICNTTTDRGYLNGTVAGNKIKQHFGVEE